MTVDGSNRTLESFRHSEIPQRLPANPWGLIPKHIASVILRGFYALIYKKISGPSPRITVSRRERTLHIACYALDSIRVGQKLVGPLRWPHKKLEYPSYRLMIVVTWA